MSVRPHDPPIGRKSGQPRVKSMPLPPLPILPCNQCGSTLHSSAAHDRTVASFRKAASLRPVAAQLLEGWANQIFARYGHPVYLVGSALEQENPRDVDVICVIPDDEFTNRFCPWRECERFGPDQSPGSKRWCAEIGKLSRECSQKHPSLNVDFKVRSADSHWNEREDHKPKLRLDTVESE